MEKYDPTIEDSYRKVRQLPPVCLSLLYKVSVYELGVGGDVKQAQGHLNAIAKC